MAVKGIDISEWQEDVDFDAVKADGIDFVILRAGYSDTVDSLLMTYARKALEAGLAVDGVYLFSYATSVSDAINEADSCVAAVRRAGLPAETIIFYDFEYDSVNKAANKGIYLGSAECIAFTKAFCERVEESGYRAGIYANIDYYENMYLGQLTDKYKFWLADYSGDADYTCDYHQYTSEGSVNGISGNVDMNYKFAKPEVTFVNPENHQEAKYSRQAVVDLVCSWEGLNEDDGSYQQIIDTYNSYDGDFPRGTQMQYGWAWCACTWSALAISLGYTEIMPIEISCHYLIERAKEMGCWQEDDSYVPSPGDAILYDWSDNGYGDDTTSPDHVGTVISVNEDAGYFVVMEGNYHDAVKRRTVSINGMYIRGFITPHYDDDTVADYIPSANKDIDTVAHEVIAGVWGTGEQRADNLESAGYNYHDVQERVNEILNGDAANDEFYEENRPTENKVTATCNPEMFSNDVAGTYVTTSDLYMRNDAGTNKKAMVVVPKDSKVRCYGYHSVYNGDDWLYVQVSLGDTLYTGFCHGDYLNGI